MLKTNILKKSVLGIYRIFKVQCFMGAVKNFMQYHSGGEDYNPPENAKVLSDYIGNDEKNGVICLYQDSVPRISESGEKRIYSTDGDGIKVAAQIYLKNDGKIIIEAESDVELISKGTVKVNASSVELGEGGMPLARQGDEVVVEGKKGVITGGGKNKSV